MKANKLIGLLARNEGPPAACSYRQFCPVVYPAWELDRRDFAKVKTRPWTKEEIELLDKPVIIPVGEKVPRGISEDELIKALAKAYNEGFDLAIGRLCDLYIDPKGALFGYVRDEAKRLKNET